MSWTFMFKKHKKNKNIHDLSVRVCLCVCVWHTTTELQTLIIWKIILFINMF